MSALAFVGDWNATPADRGRWSPQWLAAGAQLRLVSAGPGRHGDIDYAVTNAAVAGRPQRFTPPGPADGRSDHDVYRVRLTDQETRSAIVLASWNMLYGRPELRAQRDLTELLADGTIDVLALQEAADYHDPIHRAAKLHGYTVLSSSRPGRWHNVLMVKRDHRTTGAKFIQLSPHGWRLVAGGAHAELWATSWLVAGWLRVVDLHMPPSVNWTGGRIHGPVMRVAAYVASVRRLRRLAVGWHHRH